MDKAQILLVGLAILLFCSDVMNLFAPPPYKPIYHSHPLLPPNPQPYLQQSLEFPTQKQGTIVPQIGLGNTLKIDFCSSCSYRGNAVATKKLLEASFPGIDVAFSRHPRPLIKRMLSKAIPVVQVGIMVFAVAGELIFPKLGVTTPPSWYQSFRDNRLGTIASTWLIGNSIQSLLHSSGAFEVYCNGELVFSKLKENRFPGEIELKDLVGKRISNTKYDNSVEGSSVLSKNPQIAEPQEHQTLIQD